MPDYYFDERGNLFPYELITINSIDELEQLLVSNFPLSFSRNGLFVGLLEYFNDFGKVLAEIGYKET